MWKTCIAIACCAGAAADAGRRVPEDRETRSVRVEPAADGLLPTEKLAGEGVWVDPAFAAEPAAARLNVKVWFDEQLLGDGTAYRRRAEEFAGRRRSELRSAAVQTLKQLSRKSFAAAKDALDKLAEEETIADVERHWIVNGFSCTTTAKGVEALQEVPGVKQVYLAGRVQPRLGRPAAVPAEFFPARDRPDFDAGRYQHPWYVQALQADRVWLKFGAAGQGTLNVIHDFNFVFSENVVANLYRNPDETSDNGEDDDGNGLVDDYHGFNFDRGTPGLTTLPVAPGAVRPQGMHGFMCAAIVCGSGAEDHEYEFGIAPRGRWAGVIAGGKLEAAVEWAVERGADTYSMSFSIPDLNEYRSHWRKIMEHGSLCGVYFVSGAGNFAQSQRVPVQMRTPEDVPDVVFAAAGVQRDFSRTPFSSKGPVQWETAHYRDGLVQKPEVCAFNSNLPLLKLDGTVVETGISGNSFAGPMFCGAIALMLSADPDLLPWDLKEIITSTATDVAAEGVDDETGHGLINCYRAVKEVLRRKALREGTDPAPYTGREAGDTLDVEALRKRLRVTRFKVVRVQPGSQADKAGLQAGDVIARYNKEPIRNQRDMLAAKQKAEDAELKQVAVEVRRDGKPLEFQLAPGPLGVFPAVEFAEPVFRRIDD